MERELGMAPVAFVRGVLDGDPWERQEAILQALALDSRVTVRSCHGVGKSWTAACAALWFLYTRPVALVLTTAPTHRQVREVLWKEIRRLHRRMFDPARGREATWPRGELRETALRLADDRFALGLTTDETDRFQGFHSPHILVIVDEASGVGEEIFQAIEGVLTTGEARLLLIGNPLHARGTFYESHRGGPWTRFAISAFDSPNLEGLRLTDPGFADTPPRRSGLVTARWVWDRFQAWGPESPVYQSRVLGEFPDQAGDALISLAWIEAAVRRGAESTGCDGPVEFGADIARFGDCETVVCIRQGSRVRALHAWRKVDLMETCRRIEALAEQWPPAVVKVDAAGLGGGVVDGLRERGGLRVVEINGGSRPRDGERFHLLRDELFFGLRDRFRAGEISLPDDRTLADQLAALTYEVDARGRQSVTGKAELRGRGLVSPDRADALALAFAPLAGCRPVFLTGRPR